MPQHNHIAASLSDGVRSARERRGLILLFFVPALLLSASVSVPLYVVLNATTAPSGFGQVLIERFDPILLANIMGSARDSVLGTVALIAWLAPVIFLWKVASAVGLVNALRTGGVRSFWDGLGRFTGPAILISVLNLVLLGIWAFFTALAVAAVAYLLPVESGPWIPAAVALVFLTAGVGLVGLMQDFARISLVCDGRGPLKSWKEGVRYPFRYPQSLGLYGLWWVAAAVFSFLLVQTHVSRASTVEQMWLLFLLQQALLLLRSAGTVAWIGGAVGLHERIRFREAPLLALDQLRPGGQTGGQTIDRQGAA